MDGNPSKCTFRLNPDAIQSHERPCYGKRCGTRRSPQTVIEHVGGRSPRKPVVEVPKHHNRCVSDGIEIVQDLPHLKPAFVNTEAKVGCEHVQQRAANINCRRQRPASFAPFHRQIDPMNLHDGMSGQERVAEAFRHGFSRTLSCRPERALITIERRENNWRPRFQSNAGWIRELLQRDDVRVEVGDHCRHTIGIVPSVPPHARVHVVGCDPKRRMLVPP